MEFASVFKIMCKEKGVTQKTALEEMKMGRNAAQRWVDGLPSYETLVKISNYFAIPHTTLLECIESNDAEIIAALVQKKQPLSHVTASDRSTVALNNSGTVATNGASISQGPAEQLSDMEMELLRVFRGLDMRKKNALMSQAYDMEDTMKRE